MNKKDLKTLIEEQYGTVYQFIAKTPFKSSTIYKILNGKECNPTAKHVRRFVETLNCTYEEVHSAIEVTNSIGYRNDRVEPTQRQD